MQNGLSQANVIITGSSGMVGRGVLYQCLESDFIKSVLTINRTELDLEHPKLKQLVLPDFSQVDDFSDSFVGFDGCFHCMGISSVGLTEQEFALVTYDYSQQLVDACFRANPQMTFNYVSGDGTSTKENSRMMWANVKGKTENMILAKGFGDAYMFRPGTIIPEKGIKSRTKLYQNMYDVMRPFFPLLKKMNSITTTTRLGDAMVNTLRFPQQKKYLYNKDINELSSANSRKFN